MRRTTAAWLLLALCGSALGAPKVLVVGSGDCHDAQLASSVRALSRALATLPQKRVLEESALRPHLGAAPERSLEDLTQQTEAAEVQFFRAQYEDARLAAQDALEQLSRLPPGESRWALQARLHLLLGLIYGGLGKEADSDEAYLRLLRVAPECKLDPNRFAPSVRTRFEQARAQVKKAPRHTLSVESSPPGAEVFVNGLSLGPSPLRRELPAGDYLVQLSHKGQVSLQHALRLDRAQSLAVDLIFEGALSPQRFACVGAEGKAGAALESVTKLGALVGAEEVVALRLERSGGDGLLWATLLESKGARRVREGGLRITSAAGPPSGLEELSRYLATGETSGRIQTKAPSWVDSGKPSVTQRTVGAYLGGSGLALLGAGGGLLWMSMESWKRYDELYPVGRPPTQAEAREIVPVQDRAELQQTLSMACFASGAALALAGGALWWWGEKPAPVAVLPWASPGAAGVLVQLPSYGM